MNRKNNRLIVAAVLTLVAGNASAVRILVFVPPAQSVDVGSQATVDAVITGLTGELVGDYYVRVSWDANVLTLGSVIQDVFLDRPVDSLFTFDSSAAGAVEVAEISLSLLANQDGITSFRLFGLVFDAGRSRQQRAYVLQHLVRRRSRSRTACRDQCRLCRRPRIARVRSGAEFCAVGARRRANPGL
jgi:hypothetical protein